MMRTESYKGAGGLAQLLTEKIYLDSLYSFKKHVRGIKEHWNAA